MRVFSLRVVIFAISVLILTGCQKEVSFQDDTNTPGNGGGNGGGNTTGNPGWSFTAAGNATYYGCVDTAYYETISGIKTLSIDVTDSIGNTFSIILASPGNFTTTTYTPATGASILYISHDGNSYISATASSFSFKITSINDTLITADFTANLTDALGGTFSITNGKLKALIGKHNECGIDYSGGGNGGGGGSSGADYYLIAGADYCSNAEVQGKYIKDSALNADHKVTLEVWVDNEGPWNVNTTTVNGFKFSGSGEFTSTGTNTITLQATGTPLAIGSYEIPVTAGSSNCDFTVEVDTVGIAPCNQDNNSYSIALGGIYDGPFNFVGTRIIYGRYQLYGISDGGDMFIEFPDDTQPAPGVYDIKIPNGSYLYGEAGVYLVASNILWQPREGQGKLYVSIVNGKVVATFCDVEFLGTLADTYTTKVSAKITEE